MSKNTDLSELINYVKGISSGRLTFPFYTSSTAFTGTIAGYLGFDASGNILTSAGASQWTTSGSNIYFNTGFVGIGTSSTPSSILELSQPQYTFLTLTGTNATQVQMNLGVNQVTQGAYISSVTNHPLILQTNSTERSRITANGNLCLGTTTPHGTDVVATRTFTIYGGSISQIGLNNGSSGNLGLLEYTQEQLNITNSSSTFGITVVSKTGGVWLPANATSWSSLSDESTKTDLVPIEGGLNKVSLLRAITGRYKTDKVGTSRSFLIAQDVQSVLPEAVSVNQEDGYLNLSYTDVIPLLVASIQELKTELDQLKANI